MLYMVVGLVSRQSGENVDTVDDKSITMQDKNGSR